MRTIIMLLLFGCQLGFGQATDECKPSTLNIPGAKYPCVYPDDRATFRVVAPDAQKVQVRVGRDFRYGEGDRWSVDRNHDAAGRGVPLLFTGRRWRDGRGSGHADVFRLRLGQQRDRDSRSGGCQTITSPKTCRTAR